MKCFICGETPCTKAVACCKCPGGVECGTILLCYDETINQVNV